MATVESGKTKITKIIKDNLEDAKFCLIKLRDLVSENYDLFKPKVINFIGIGTLFLTDIVTSGYLQTQEFISQISFFNSSSADSQCREWYRNQPDPKIYMDHFCRNNIACRPNIDANFPASFDTFIQDKSCNPNNPKYCDLFHRGKSMINSRNIFHQL